MYRTGSQFSCALSQYPYDILTLWSAMIQLWELHLCVTYRSRAGIVTDYDLDDQGYIPGRARTVSYPAQPPIPWVKRSENEADLSYPSTVEVKNAWGCASIPPWVFREWCLRTQRDSTFIMFFCFCFYSTSGTSPLFEYMPLRKHL